MLSERKSKIDLLFDSSCRTLEMHERNNETGNWIWIDVGLIIVGNVGWLTASLVADQSRQREGAENDERVRLRGEADINQCWLNV